MIVLFPASELLQTDECPKEKKVNCAHEHQTIWGKNEEYIIECKKKIAKSQGKFWEQAPCSRHYLATFSQ